MIETNNYWIVDNKFIFKPEFNEKFDDYYDLILKYNCLIFSDYEDVNTCIGKNNLYDYYIKSKFNQKVEIPENITHLTFGDKFNQKVELPNNITHLTFGRDFDQEVELPNNITHLTFGFGFNQEVELPINLTHLTFDFCFNQKISLPINLTHLTLGFDFNQNIDIPLKVKYLNLDCNNLRIIDYLPNSIEELELNYNFNLELNNLPSSIKIIKFHEYSFYDKELNNLPNSIELIQLPPKYPYQIKNIPKQLKK